MSFSSPSLISQHITFLLGVSFPTFCGYDRNYSRFFNLVWRSLIVFACLVVLSLVSSKTTSNNTVLVLYLLVCSLFTLAAFKCYSYTWKFNSHFFLHSFIFTIACTTNSFPSLHNIAQLCRELQPPSINDYFEQFTILKLGNTIIPKLP